MNTLYKILNDLKKAFELFKPQVQLKNDDSLTTNAKEVSGSINELKQKQDEINTKLDDKVDTSTLSNYPTNDEVDRKISDNLGTQDSEIETIKLKVNELINKTNIIKNTIVVGSSDDGINFTISELDGVDKSKVTVYALGMLLEDTQFSISGTTLTLVDPLEQDQYIVYIIDKTDVLS